MRGPSRGSRVQTPAEEGAFWEDPSRSAPCKERTGALGALCVCRVSAAWEAEVAQGMSRSTQGTRPQEGVCAAVVPALWGLGGEDPGSAGSSLILQ